jgi:hypothetical protein
MAATPAGFARAHIVRVVRASRRNRYDSGAYVAPHEYVPQSTAELWRGPRRFSR